MRNQLVPGCVIDQGTFELLKILVNAQEAVVLSRHD